VTGIGSWTRDTHTADGRTYPTYRKGAGPGVVIVHELPGLTSDVVAFAEEVVSAGHTVVLPHLFGDVDGPASLGAVAKVLPRVCVSSEFTKLALHVTAPIADWLRSLARHLHGELGGPGVGALGMCFTGGFALAMMVDPAVVAPVVCQPSLPFAIGRRRSADLNLSPEDLDVVERRAAAGCAVLGLRYRSDPATGTRFETLRDRLGEDFLAVEFEGRGHSVVTMHRQQEAVDRILAFFDQRLTTAAGPTVS
jgi:dienelactone hydrolase